MLSAINISWLPNRVIPFPFGITCVTGEVGDEDDDDDMNALVPAFTDIAQADENGCIPKLILEVVVAICCCPSVNPFSFSQGDIKAPEGLEGDPSPFAPWR